MMALMMTLVLATQAADIETLRKDYSNCVVDMTIESLDNNMADRAFKKAAAEACPEKREKYIEALFKDERDFGASDSEAREYAEEEADAVLLGMVNGYADMKAANTRPVREQ